MNKDSIHHTDEVYDAIPVAVNNTDQESASTDNPISWNQKLARLCDIFLPNIVFDYRDISRNKVVPLWAISGIYTLTLLVVFIAVLTTGKLILSTILKFSATFTS